MNAEGTGPIAVYLTGETGVGKTTLAKQLSKRLGLVYVGNEDLRWKWYDTPKYTAAEDAKFFRAVDALTAHLLAAGHNVLRDGRFPTRVVREETRLQMWRAGVRFCYLSMILNNETRLARLREREVQRPTKRDYLQPGVLTKEALARRWQGWTDYEAVDLNEPNTYVLDSRHGLLQLVAVAQHIIEGIP